MRTRTTDPDQCDHDWRPVGFLGPYPIEECPLCGWGVICDIPGWPPAMGVIVDALARAGCAPHPAETQR